MNNKILKFIPLVLLASLIAEIIPMVAKDLNISTTSWTILLPELLFTGIISFIIFYADMQRNNSTIDSFGMITIVIYAILTIIYMAMIQNITSIDDIKTVGTIQKLTATTTSILLTLKYIAITNLVSLENNSKYTDVLKKITIAVAVATGLIGILFTWGAIKVNTAIYVIYAMSDNIFKAAIYSFILIQVIEANENLNKKVEEIPQQTVETPPVPETNNMFSSNTPKFRNPALEAQEARLAEQKRAQEALTNQQAIPQQQPVPASPQPVVNNTTLQQNPNNINGQVQ